MPSDFSRREKIPFASFDVGEFKSAFVDLVVYS
jgi:hypothetical protein